VCDWLPGEDPKRQAVNATKEDTVATDPTSPHSGDAALVTDPTSSMAQPNRAAGPADDLRFQPRERPGRRPASRAREAGDRPSPVATARGLTLVAGIWLIIAPFVLGYAGDDPTWNDIVFGAIVAILALAGISGLSRHPALSYATGLIGAWIFASAFWLESSATAAWNDVILGFVVFVLAIISARADAPTYAKRGRSPR
jgi:SPW repeat-containing protein